MVLLIPVTLPPGAQAAHTSVIDGNTHTVSVQQQGSWLAKSAMFSPTDLLTCYKNSLFTNGACETL